MIGVDVGVKRETGWESQRGMGGGIARRTGMIVR